MVSACTLVGEGVAVPFAEERIVHNKFSNGCGINRSSATALRLILLKLLLLISHHESLEGFMEIWGASRGQTNSALAALLRIHSVSTSDA